MRNRMTGLQDYRITGWIGLQDDRIQDRIAGLQDRQDWQDAQQDDRMAGLQDDRMAG